MKQSVFKVLIYMAKHKQFRYVVIAVLFPILGAQKIVSVFFIALGQLITMLGHFCNGDFKTVKMKWQRGLTKVDMHLGDIIK